MCIFLNLGSLIEQDISLAVPNLPSSQPGVLDNSEDDIYNDDFGDEDDPNDETYSPEMMEDSLKFSETCSEQSSENIYVRMHLETYYLLDLNAK